MILMFLLAEISQFTYHCSIYDSFPARSRLLNRHRGGTGADFCSLLVEVSVEKNRNNISNPWEGDKSIEKWKNFTELEASNISRWVSFGVWHELQMPNFRMSCLRMPRMPCQNLTLGRSWRMLYGMKWPTTRFLTGYGGGMWRVWHNPKYSAWTTARKGKKGI